MVKKMISGFLALLLILCAFSPAAYADDEHQHTFGEVTDTVDTKGLKLPNGQDFPVNVSITKSPCSTPGISCGKVLYSWNFGGRGGSFVDDKDLPVAEVIKRWYEWNERFYGNNVGFTQFQAGGGSASPGGVGRHPAGYAGEGTPSVSYEGNNIYKLEPYFWSSISGFNYESKYYPTACPQWEDFPVLNIADYPDVSFSNNTLSIYNSHSYCGLGVVYGMYAPVAGKYSIYKNPDVAKVTYSFSNGDGPYTGNLIYNEITSLKHSDFDEYVQAGSSLYWQFGFSFGRLETRKKIKISASSLYVYCEPSQSTIIQQNNITINNNTWNGNIYVDNSNKLTYIYPQYTTINENNETITNISNNPIIYNQETKQYYTYDSVTNNYYYITYNAPTPTPTPTPTPDPTPTPSPDVPPTPIVPETQNLIVPKMNANSFTDEHGTWVASGSSKYSDVFDFFYAFDRSTANFWETNASPSYLQIEIPDPENYYIDGYIMRISKFTNRYAKEWTLQGSDDGNTWDDLDKQTGQNLSDLEEHKYPLTLRKAYKYYRVNMSNYASSMCSLSHFNLLGYAAKDVTFPTPDPGGSGGGSGTTPTPTPAPTPDGGSDGSGGGSGFNPLKWLAELLKDIVEGIFKAIWKLITSIFGFLIWLVSLLGMVLPFIPAEGLAALSAAAIIITVIRIIKFILGR